MHVTYIHTNLISGYAKAIWEILVLHDVKTQLRAQGSTAVSRRRLTKYKSGLQSRPGLVLVSGLGFSLGQSCFV